MNSIHSPPVKKPPLWCAITTGNGTLKATVNPNNSGHFRYRNYTTKYILRK